MFKNLDHIFFTDVTAPRRGEDAVRQSEGHCRVGRCPYGEIDAAGEQSS